ncbi:MAG: molybdopterin-dependent oxidoreductase, partial [Acetobacteraceae bacterium]|nr:molybdopterin-dependent oxidoreductase [Acetobacteraceae bacterium]
MKILRRAFLRGSISQPIKVPGMVHGRMVRPNVAGAVPVKVYESSIKEIPGAKVVWNQGFLGVVADTEWDAIKASRQLKVEWSDAQPPFPDQATLYHHIRSAPIRKREFGGKTAGDVDAAFKGVARVIEAEYEWPFQSHASMGPACTVADVNDDQVTVWTGSQKPHSTREGVATILGVPAEKVHAMWVPGPGSYGRNDAGDAAVDAALL